MPCTHKWTPLVTWSKKKEPITSLPSRTINPRSNLISRLSTSALFPPHGQTIDKAHGRIEIRQIWTSTDLNDYLQFPHAHQVFCIRRQVVHFKNNKSRDEIVYGITSLPVHQANASRLLRLNRGHWGIENGLHYVRDVSFDEDRS